jgi:hypothetical protein
MKNNIKWKLCLGVIKWTFCIISLALFIFFLAAPHVGIDLSIFNHGVGATLAGGINLTSYSLSKEAGAKDGDEGMGGFGSVGYLALRSHIKTYPTLPANPTNDDELVTLNGNYVMMAGMYFIKIYYSPDSINLDPESQGENVGGKSFQPKGKFFIAGFNNKPRALARILNNSSGVLIFIDDDGTRISIGTQQRPVTFKPKGKSGSKAADAKGFECEFTTDSFVPGFTYNGEIPLSGETLPAVSS